MFLYTYIYIYFGRYCSYFLVQIDYICDIYVKFVCKDFIDYVLSFTILESFVHDLTLFS